MEEERRKQNELRAAAAERRMQQASSPGPVREPEARPTTSSWENVDPKVLQDSFCLLFGDSATSKTVLTQWTTQGLVLGDEVGAKHVLLQLQGGPCAVLAPLQAFLMKHLVFRCDFGGDLAGVTHAEVRRALQGALCEALWRAGNYEGGCVLKLVSPDAAKRVKDRIERMEDGCDVEGVVSCVSEGCFQLKRFENRVEFLSELGDALGGDLRGDLGVLVVLLSILLSRGVERVQDDRDDTSQPLITLPFGHASQEIVNLFLCGKAVTNVFDGDMDMGGDYKLKGISSRTQVGFLTLLESHNYLTVGRYLKEPEYPIWVLGSDSHYTVLFSLDRAVQDESEREKREKEVRKIFDEHDKSGGGGFIERADLQSVLQKARCAEGAARDLASQDVVTWHELRSSLRGSEFGAGDEAGPAVRTLHMYHVNGIAKSSASGEGGQAKPTLKAVTVTLTKPLEAMQMDVPDENLAMLTGENAQKAQWCPLVDCIRTRWKQAECHWEGEAPSMV